MFCRIGALENIVIFTGKHLCWGIFFIKLQTRRPPKEIPAQVFSYEYCEIFKNRSLHRTPLVAASGDIHLTLQIKNKSEAITNLMRSYNFFSKEKTCIITNEF